MKYFMIVILLLLSLTAFADSFNLDNVNDLYVVWQEIDDGDSEIYIARRENGQWGEKEKLTENDRDDFSPCVALDNKGNPWVVWAGDDGINTAIYTRYHNGKKWSIIHQVDNVDLYSDTFPAIAFSENNIPYVVWSGSDGKDDDIYISSFRGSSWAAEEMVNIDDDSPDLMPVLAEQAGGGFIISWMGYNGRNYELYYTQLGKAGVSGEKVFSLSKGYSFGECASFISTQDNLRLCWWEKNECKAVNGNGSNWLGEEDVLFSSKDEFIKNLMDNLKVPVWVAWISQGQGQNFRMVPMYRQNNIQTAQYTWLTSWLDFFDSSLYAATTTPPPPPAEPTKYVAFGDSITEGSGPGLEYPLRLEIKLDNDKKIGDSVVINEGLGGERTYEGIGRIDSVLDEHKPKYILIMEGTNDVTWHYSTESIMFNLTQMVDHSIIRGTKPLLAKLTPRRDSLDNRTKDEINPGIEKIAKDKAIISVDQYTKMAADKLKYIEDHVHPTAEGYELMSQVWYDAISAMINPPKKTSDSGGGCGSVIVPLDKSGGKGINLGVLIFVFIFGIWYRSRLCRN